MIQVPIKKDKFYKAALKLINCFIGNLTEYELDIISTMLNYRITKLNKETRAYVKGVLKSDTAVFNNYIKRLKDKGVLVDNEGELELSKGIVNAVAKDEITIKFDVN